MESPRADATRDNGLPLLRVLIVDDTSAMRELIRLALMYEPDFEIVAEAATGVEAVRLAAQLSPDVVVMDGVMPVMDGAEATRLIRERSPWTAVLAYTADADLEWRMRQAGACGCLPKGARVHEVVDGLRRAAATHELGGWVPGSRHAT